MGSNKRTLTRLLQYEVNKSSGCNFLVLINFFKFEFHSKKSGPQNQPILGNYKMSHKLQRHNVENYNILNIIKLRCITHLFRR